MTGAALLRRAALAVRGAALRAGATLPAVCQAHGEVQAASWQRARRLGRCQSRASPMEPLVRALGRRRFAMEQLEMGWADALVLPCSCIIMRARVCAITL